MIFQINDLGIRLELLLQFAGKLCGIPFDVPHTAVQKHYASGLRFQRAVKLWSLLLTLSEGQLFHVASDVGAYRLHVLPCAFLLLHTQVMPVENEGEGFVLIVASLVVCLAFDHLELRKHVADAPVKGVLDESRESAVRVSADDRHLVGVVYQGAHILISVLVDTLSRGFPPAAEASRTGTYGTVIRHHSPAFIVRAYLIPFIFT